MNAKISPGGHGRVQYLLRCAFAAAEEGDRDEAYLYWNQAIAEGYHGKGRTLANLEFTLERADRSRLDPAPTINEPPPSMNHGGMAERIAERRMWRLNRAKPES